VNKKLNIYVISHALQPLPPSSCMGVPCIP